MNRIITGIYFSVAALLALIPVFIFSSIGSSNGGNEAVLTSVFSGMFFAPFAFFWGAVLSDFFCMPNIKSQRLRKTWFFILGVIITGLTIFSLSLAVSLGSDKPPSVATGLGMIVVSFVFTLGTVPLVGGITGRLIGAKLHDLSM